MKKIFFLACLSFIVFLQLEAQNTDSVWLRENYYKIERMLPMRDGIKLFTAFYIPKDSSTKHPILFNRTPYTCSPYGEDKFNARLYGTYWLNYLKESYLQTTHSH